MNGPHESMSLPMALPGFVEQLANAFAVCKDHRPGDPAVDRPVSSTLGHLRLMLQETGKDEVTLLVAGGGLAFQGRTPIQTNEAVEVVVGILHRWGASGLRFQADATEQEVGALLWLATRPEGQRIRDLAALVRASERAGCRHVTLVASAPKPQRSERESLRGAQTDRIRTALDESFTAVAAGQLLDLPRIRECADAILVAVDMAVRAGSEGLDLSRGPDDDPMVIDHSVRVSALTMITARAMAAPSELVSRLGVAALLHDLGRILLPQDAAGFDGVRPGCAPDDRIEHTVRGAEYLLSHADVDPLCVTVAFGHHTPIGAGGGPLTCHEHTTSRFTQLVRIADVFESLTAPGPARAALCPDDAYRSLLTEEPGIDRGLLRRFVEANGIHPIGSHVGLGADVTARVVRQTAKPDAPIVRVLEPGRSNAPQGALVDLSRKLGVKARFLAPATR